MAHRYYSWTHRNVTHFISPNLASPLACSSSESGTYTRLAAPNTWHCLCLPTLWKWKQPRSWESGDLELSPSSATQLLSHFRQVTPKSFRYFSENKGIGLDHCFSGLSNTWILPLKKNELVLWKFPNIPRCSDFSETSGTLHLVSTTISIFLYL